ncbi:hypothetical protein C7T35_33760 [Variovorax sp. WS11]|uniref:hypothetical protein n=1 Tax=Variovorax sp. WS11 TaxID=1105204 RepID=UPI000D0DC51E|nr:hypothetical protein [Variovorax sp. WS11]NDZ13846.1 hypothetical protein [Variovorax sp. WS11]PSL80153.1 hypothetical protein C7T35_33760 [Variovorax sp. WS11]
MNFTAGAFPLAIDHRLEGKLYNANPIPVKALPKGAATTDPFDTQIVDPGDTWELPAGAEFIRQRELRGAATPQGTTPD